MRETMDHASVNLIDCCRKWRSRIMPVGRVPSDGTTVLASLSRCGNKQLRFFVFALDLRGLIAAKGAQCCWR
jgi:hypothetical protein